MANYIKWYFNIAKWKPTRHEWLRLISSVADEEIQRINKFVYQDDTKAALVGRALIRKFVSHVIRRPTSELKLTRTTHGRPIISSEYKNQLGHSWPKVFDFNISHSGDFCVLVGVWSYEESPEITVGVDVSKIVSKETKHDLDRFLSLMSKKFIPSEWEIVDKVSDDKQKCINFTRLWCLKESFIKSIGLGLKFALNRISFEPAQICRFYLNPNTLQTKMLDNTKVWLDGRLADDWLFHETALDDHHLVAVGFNVKASNLSNFNIDTSLFQELTIGLIMDELTIITKPREENWSLFNTKPSRS